MFQPLLIAAGKSVPLSSVLLWRRSTAPHRFDYFFERHELPRNASMQPSRPCAKRQPLTQSGMISTDPPAKARASPIAFPPRPHAAQPAWTVKGHFGRLFNRLRSRSLSELTRQFIPPTTNDHAPPP